MTSSHRNTTTTGWLITPFSARLEPLDTYIGFAPYERASGATD